jgi:hypothetical protein
MRFQEASQFRVARDSRQKRFVGVDRRIDSIRLNCEKKRAIEVVIHIELCLSIDLSRDCDPRLLFSSVPLGSRLVPLDERDDSRGCGESCE